MEKIIKFPPGFLWGSATAAYQVEGGIENSDWSRVYPAGRAADQYHLYEHDFDIALELNQNAHRFSLEWSRLEPAPGRFDEKEIAHYRQVLMALKMRGLTTLVTLCHFTNPVWLADLGGWENPKAVFYFSRFAERIFKDLNQLVDYWVTINELFASAQLGYLVGLWPPKKRNLIAFFKVIKNQIAGHRQAYEILHQLSSEVRVGIANNHAYYEPFNPGSPLDKLSVFLADYFSNRYLMNRIKNHLDFIGLNYYFHFRLKFPLEIRNENKVVSDIGWEVYPQGIYYVLKELKKYDRPIFITENGVADAEDKTRKEFIKNHLFWISRAMEEGADVRGYFYWSLIDNFEWEKGFWPRFGLVEIDYKTMERKIRPSAYDYAKICQANRLVISNEISPSANYKP